ncbi:MAG: hypothetical protein V1659_05315, partial [Candidatus Woesearchaeota archaeon]
MPDVTELSGPESFTKFESDSGRPNLVVFPDHFRTYMEDRRPLDSSLGGGGEAVSFVRSLSTRRLTADDAKAFELDELSDSNAELRVGVYPVSRGLHIAHLIFPSRQASGFQREPDIGALELRNIIRERWNIKSVPESSKKGSKKKTAGYRDADPSEPIFVTTDEGLSLVLNSSGLVAEEPEFLIGGERLSEKGTIMGSAELSSALYSSSTHSLPLDK